ncbi:hypothetical protein IJJ18_02920 [Candidatus Saccharibacteria bacterium]|nr:hypothetical protein [Candidatus Saccharibacteria bacterium]
MTKEFNDLGVILVDDESGREEFLYAEEYEEAYMDYDEADLKFGTIIELQMAYNQAKERERRATERSLEEYANASEYWHKWDVLVGLCSELGRKRKTGQFTGYLPRRVNDAMNMFSEAGRAVGFWHLDKQTRDNIEMDLYDPKLRRKYARIIDPYRGRCEAMSAVELYQAAHN